MTELLAILGAIVSGLLAFLALKNPGKPKRPPKSEPPPKPKTTTAEDKEVMIDETDAAIDDAIETHPKSNPSVVSDLVGLADRER